MKKIILLTALTLFSMNAIAHWTHNPVTWTTVNGQQWSNVLPGTYVNVDLNRGVNGIPATEVCKAIGGRIPTKGDFINLCKTTNQFEIPGMANTHLWSSTNDQFGA